MKSRIRAEVNPRLRSLQDVFDLDRDDMREMLIIVDERFTRNEKRLFATEGRSGGAATHRTALIGGSALNAAIVGSSGWQALSPAYKKAKARRFPGRKILAATGRLRRSLANKNDPRHVATFALRPRQVLQVGTEDRKAAFHAPGRLHNPRLPVRDPLQHTASQERRYTRLVTDWLIEFKLDRIKRAMARWSQFSAGRRFGRGRK